MLTLIPGLTFLKFAIIYPLCFWISVQDPLKQNFHKFHLGLPNIIGAMSILILCSLNISSIAKIWLSVWFGTFIILSASQWNKGSPHPLIFSFPFILGIFAYQITFSELISPNVIQTLTSLLAGFILCASLFAMNLGHWYLNVHGLPISHMKRSVHVLCMLLILRLIWNILSFTLGKLYYREELISLYQFILKMDGIFLLLGILFGILFPLASLYFVYGTLKIKNTQSATGILYVILIAILIGDLTYQFYLLKFGIAL